MNLSSLVEMITPPVILHALTGKKTQSMPEYGSWDQALQASTADAYENDKLTRLIFDKTIAYRDKLSSQPLSINSSEIQTLTALGIAHSLAMQPKRITVIDFGGACGAHFFLAKHIFDTTEFDWRVVETPGMVQHAQQVQSDELRFFSDIDQATEDAGVIDLVHSSGTLQCVAEPYRVLERLMMIQARCMLLSRLGVTPESSEINTTHRHMMSANGPGPAPPDFKDEICIYPFRYPVKGKIEKILSTRYDLEFISNDPTGAFSVGSHVVAGITYFCRKR